MKNITVAVNDEVYRRARIKAAEQDTSVSALVRDFLSNLAVGPTAPLRDWKREQEELINSIHQRHPGFTSKDNLSRTALHDRDALR